jgi:type II secretory pathway component PulF
MPPPAAPQRLPLVGRRDQRAQAGEAVGRHQPIMIVVLGVIVGGMIVAMYLPIFGMINAVQ